MHAPTISPMPNVPARMQARRPRSTSLWRRIAAKRWSYLYLAPMLVLVAVFTIYPLFASLGYTFYKWNGIGDPTVFVGFQNFLQVMHDPIFWGSFQHTFIYMLILVPIQLTLALILALVLNNPKLRFAAFYRSVYFLPVVTSPAVIGVIFQLILANFGDSIDKLLAALHITTQQIDWLGDPRFALGCIIGIGIWNTLGYNLVYFLAGLQTIPTELYEAAKIDGANAFHRFTQVTVPMLRPIGLVIVILAVLGSLQVFDLVQVLTQGGPYFATEVVNTYIYHQAFGNGGINYTDPNIGFASAASFFYGIILMLLAGLQVLIFRYARNRRITS